MSIPVFDLECLKWTQPIAVGYIIKDEYHEVLKTSDDVDVVWEFLKEIQPYKGTKFFAHNAAGYDNRFLLDTLTKHGQKVEFKAGLGGLKWVEAGISFEDSYLVLGRGLAVCCEAFDIPRKLEWNHEETTEVWEMGSKLDTFRAYLKRDVTSLSMVLEAFSKQLLDLFGIVPSTTMSLTAVKAFNKGFFPVDQIYTNEEFETFIRQATYGGRNEVYKRYGENIYFYDVKRMFMSCYDTPIPIGKMGWCRPNIDKGVLAEAKVHIPDSMHIGPLPYRDPNRQNHLIYPVGDIKGWWDMVLLRNAVKLGCDVTLLRQLDGAEAPILDDFGKMVGKLGDLSNAEMGKLWKIFGLRLTGKFGQHRLRTEIRHISDIEDQTGWYPIDASEIYQETTTYQTGNRSPYIKPAVNMRIRSEASVRHLNLLLKAKDPYYSDTDSIYTTVPQEVGTIPGTLRQIDFAQKGWFIGTKFYGYVNKAGILKQKTAGFRDFHLTEEDFNKLLVGKDVAGTFVTMGNWREILKGKGVERLNHSHTFSEKPLNNRIMDGIKTRPIKLPE